jgi:hypothetical protein
MDMFWPADTKLVSNVARQAKRVAHPWVRPWGKLLLTGKGKESVLQA